MLHLTTEETEVLAFKNTHGQVNIMTIERQILSVTA